MTWMTPLVAKRSVCWTKAELSRLAATLITPFLNTCVAIDSDPAVSCTSQEIPRAYSVLPMITCRRKIRLSRSLFCKISSSVSRGIRSNASSVGAKTVKGPARKEREALLYNQGKTFEDSTLLSVSNSPRPAISTAVSNVPKRPSEASLAGMSSETGG